MGAESGRTSLARVRAVESPRRRRWRKNCSPEEMQVMRLRLCAGRHLATAVFARAAADAIAEISECAARIALVDDACAITTMNSRQRRTVLRASSGAKRLHTFFPHPCAHIAILSQRAIIRPDRDEIRAAVSCIFDSPFITLGKSYQTNLTSTLQLPYKIVRFTRIRGTDPIGGVKVVG